MTNSEKIKSIKRKKPSFVYSLLGIILKPIMYKKYGVKIYDNIGMKKIKEQHIFISNHTSRIDYFFNAFHMIPKKYNFVVGYNEFYRTKFQFIAKNCGLIPKKNFTPDFYAIKEIKRIIKNGGNIAIFPEGMNSIGGMNQPVAIGTGKMIKHFKLPVYYSVVKGGYLVTPKYSLDERPGTVEVYYDRMFTKEEIEELSPEEIEDIINDKLFVDHYKWNKEKRYKYKTKGKVAEGLHTLLYKCPKCMSEFEMESSGDVLRCKHCGNGIKINDYYDMEKLNDDSVIPFETQSDWFNWEREEVKKEVKDEKFKFSIKCKLGMLPEDHMIKDDSTSEIVGEGTLTIDRNGLTFVGTKNNENYTFKMNSLNLPTYGMCTDVSKFYAFPDGVFHEFYPEIPCTEKFVLVTEEIHRLNKGKWQDFKFDKTKK